MRDSLSARNAMLAAAVPWLIAIAGFAFDIAAYWPGQMSFDSAYAWWQARGGETTDIAPPMLIFVWRICDAWLEGPGLVFALHLVLFWSGLALLASALRAGLVRTAALMLIAACAPVPWLLRGHVWTDVALFSALLFAVGALARAQATRRRRWIFAALPALIYAAAVRHNALPAVLPLAIWLGWIATEPESTRTRVAVAAAALVAILVATTALVNGQVQRRVPLWPAAAEWDLGALSVATGEMLLPLFHDRARPRCAGACRRVSRLEHHADAAEHATRCARSLHGESSRRISSPSSGRHGSARYARILARGSRIAGAARSRCSACTIPRGRAS